MERSETLAGTQKVKVKERHMGENNSAQVLHTPQNPNTFEIGSQEYLQPERVCAAAFHI